MRIDRRTFLLTAFAASACTRRRAGQHEALERALEYLRTQQAADGGFHSTTYGLLRSGQSLTPLVIGALQKAQERTGATVSISQTIERALEFIRENTDSEGALGRVGRMDNPAEDYPNYATSLAVCAFATAKPAGWREQVAAMVTQLRKQQFYETNGWRPSDPSYGGWGMGGAIRMPPDAGHVDLSMTRCVLEALSAAGVPSSDEAMKRALTYLGRSQNSDGGFYFSTVNLETNKAGETNNGPLSYGTATADGLLALRAAGVPDSDERNSKAIDWLKAHHQTDRAPGFEGARETWGSGLRFYYAYVISRALPELRIDLPVQSDDGRFSNPNNMVKEDDPLIATSFAVYTLSRQG